MRSILWLKLVIYEGPSQSVNLNKMKHGSLYLKMDIHGIFINCLVDTGSTLTILHSRKYFGKSFKQRFIVADIDVPAVLGYDFLHLHDCKIDMGEAN